MANHFMNPQYWFPRPELLRGARSLARQILAMSFVIPCFGSANAEELTIGVIQSLRGIAAQDGTTVVRSLQISAEELKRQGQQLKLAIEDDNSNPQETISAYQKLKSQGVRVIVGATWNFLTNPLAPLAAKDGIVVLNTSVPVESLSIEESRGMLFTVSPSIRSEARQFEAFARRGKHSRVGILYVDNSWGEAQSELYQRVAQELGMSVSAVMHTAGNDDVDLRALVHKISLTKPDLLLLFLNDAHLENTIRRAAEIHFHPAIFGSKNLYDAFSASHSREQYEGVCFAYPLKSLRAPSALRDQYRALYQEEPRIYADTSYDALPLILQALKRSKSENLSLADAFRSTTIAGLSGPLSYSKESSFSSGEPNLVCIEKGEMIVREN